MDSTANVHERIIAVIRDLPSIGKDSRMSGGGVSYNYRGIDDVMPHIKALFARHGVHLVPEFTILHDDMYSVDKNGRSTRWRHVTVAGKFTFFAPDGSSVSATTIGEGKDSADKAFNKAMTAALKYAVIQTFSITEGDDPDAEYPDDSTEQSRGRPAAAEVEEAPTALQQLLVIRDDLKAKGLYEGVVAYAADQGVDLLPGTADAEVAKVLAFARDQLQAV